MAAFKSFASERLFCPSTGAGIEKSSEKDVFDPGGSRQHHQGNQEKMAEAHSPHYAVVHHDLSSMSTLECTQAAVRDVRSGNRHVFTRP